MQQTGPDKTRAYNIAGEVPRADLKYLPDYLKRVYLLQQTKYRDFTNINTVTENGQQFLKYRVYVPKTQQYVDVTVEASAPVKIIMNRSDETVPKTFLDQLYDDLFLMVQLFEEETRKTTLYLAFMPNEKEVPEKENRSIVGRIFTESMLPLYIMLTTVTFAFFWIFGVYGPIIFVAVVFMLSIFSGVIVGKSGDWEITEKQQEIVILQYQFSPQKFEEFKKKYTQNISDIRKKIHQESIARGELPNCETSSKTFSEYGMECTPENLSVKRVNVYQIVKTAAEKFGLKLPKIVIKNTIVPNAAAAGPTATLGTVMITTGILTQLEEDELLSVIGHEMSHLKAHDPIVMSFMTSLEFLVRFYVVLPIIATFGLLVFWGYFIVALTLIYFFGKFLEGRADLDSAKIIGQPKVLAEALKKIAFRRLFPLNKREPEFKGYRRSEWLRFDPHPPTYHRIGQLENIKEPEKIRHTLLRTIKDNIKGFLRAT
jgi:heat shock protein HtpX